MFQRIVRIAAICGLLALGATVVAADQAPKTLRVYFIGNSVTDTINYRGLAELAKSRSYTQVWGRHMIPGAPLQWIWEHPKDGFQEPPFGHYPTALTNFQWDAISLQPFDRHLDGKDGDIVMAKKFIDLALKKSPELQVYVYARWPRQQKDDFDTAWLKKYTGKWDGTNETKDYFERLTLELRKAYPKLKIHTVPVGHVLYGLNQWMKAGKVPGYTDIKQLFADGIHLNNVGSYVVGCTYFATLYKQNPTGLPSAPYKVTDTKLTAVIQDLVWRIVRWDELAGVAAYYDAIEWKVIADTMGCDRITHTHVYNLLASKEIECRIEGSILYGVSVPKQQAEEAIRILREDVKKRGYWMKLSVDDHPKVAEPTPMLKQLPIAQVLTRPEFAKDKPLGRLLRSPDLTAKLKTYPFVKSLSVREQEYLATKNTTDIGYEVEIELRPKACDDSKGFLVRYYVSAQGRRIEGNGGTEWKRGQ